MIKNEYQKPDIIIRGLRIKEVIRTSPMSDGGVDDWNGDNVIERGQSLPPVD